MKTVSVFVYILFQNSSWTLWLLVRRWCSRCTIVCSSNSLSLSLYVMFTKRSNVIFILSMNISVRVCVSVNVCVCVCVVRVFKWTSLLWTYETNCSEKYVPCPCFSLNRSIFVVLCVIVRVRLLHTQNTHSLHLNASFWICLPYVNRAD